MTKEEAISKLQSMIIWGDFDDKTAVEMAIEALDRPTEDVEAVVRCKDCKFRDGSACEYSAVWVHPNGYCHWGRKENE